MAQCVYPVTHGSGPWDTEMRRKLLVSRGLNPNLCGNQGYQPTGLFSLFIDKLQTITSRDRK